MAARYGHTNIVQALLRAGADPNWPMVNQWETDNDPVQGHTMVSQQTPLHVAVQYGHIDIVRLLLGADPAADPNWPNRHKDTPLHVAACFCHDWNKTVETALSGFGYTDIVQVLLNAGADPNRLNNRQQTPLDVAVEWERFDTVQLLERAGSAVRVMALQSQNVSSDLMKEVQKYGWR